MKFSTLAKKIQFGIWIVFGIVVVLYEIKAYYQDEPVLPTVLFVASVGIIACNMFISEGVKCYETFYE